MSRLIQAVENTIMPKFLGKVFSASVAADMKSALMDSLKPEISGLKDVGVSMSNGSLLLAVKADKCYDVTVSFPRCGLELSACPSQNTLST